MVSPRKVRTEDGVELHVDVHPAVGERWGTALVLHPMMADRRSMDRPAGSGLASTLAASGLDVWNADLRGHGLSGHHGPWTYDEFVYLDIPALARAARERGGPTWLVGLSLGGHTGIASLGQGLFSVDGAVLLSSNVWCPSYEPSRLLRLKKAWTYRSFLTLSRAVGHFPTRRLGIGPADEALPYVEDLVRFWREDAWTSRDGADFAAGLANVHVPVLALVGRGDHLPANAPNARRWIAGVPDCRFAAIGRGDLGLTHDPDHMGLGADPRCRPAWRWIAQWMRTARMAQ